MVLMEQSAEDGFSLYGVKIIHNHLIIMSVAFAGQVEELVFLVAENNVSERFIQFFKFILRLLHIFLKFG